MVAKPDSLSRSPVKRVTCQHVKYLDNSENSSIFTRESRFQQMDWISEECRDRCVLLSFYNTSWYTRVELRSQLFISLTKLLKVLYGMFRLESPENCCLISDASLPGWWEQRVLILDLRFPVVMTASLFRQVASFTPENWPKLSLRK